MFFMGRFGDDLRGLVRSGMGRGRGRGRSGMRTPVLSVQGRKVGNSEPHGGALLLLLGLPSLFGLAGALKGFEMNKVQDESERAGTYFRLRSGLERVAVQDIAYAHLEH